MKLFFYRSKIYNFGDYLNLWIWPKIFPNFFDDNEDVIFVGIGTILDVRIPKKPKKIVFGSGVRFPKNVPKVDEKWDIRALRGKLSAKVLKVEESKAITDPAILVRDLWNYSNNNPTRDGYNFGYIPYFRNNSPLLKKACKMAGVKFINPQLSVEKCIAEITSCKYIFSEALHGAIIADTFRIPWVPIRSFNVFHEKEVHFFKWKDWCSSLDLTFKPETLPIFWLEETLNNKIKNLIKLVYFILKLMKLKSSKNFSLSSDSKFENARKRYIAVIEKFKIDYGII